MTEWAAVRVVTPSASPVVTEEQFNVHLRRENTEADPESELMARAISAAVGQLEGPDGIGYALLTQTWELTLDAFPSRRNVVYLPGAPVSAVASILYDDPAGVERTLAADQYRVTVGGYPARVQPVDVWPDTLDGIGAVRIRYLLGVDDVASIPAELVDCVLLMASTLYELRGFTPGEGGSMAWPPQARYIMGKYRQGFVS